MTGQDQNAMSERYREILDAQLKRTEEDARQAAHSLFHVAHNLATGFYLARVQNRLEGKRQLGAATLDLEIERMQAKMSKDAYELRCAHDDMARALRTLRAIINKQIPLALGKPSETVPLDE